MELKYICIIANIIILLFIVLLLSLLLIMCTVQPTTMFFLSLFNDLMKFFTSKPEKSYKFFVIKNLFKSRSKLRKKIIQVCKALIAGLE